VDCALIIKEKPDLKIERNSNPTDLNRDRKAIPVATMAVDKE